MRRSTSLLAALAACLHALADPAFAASPQILEVVEESITIHDRPAKVFKARQPDGTWGIRGTKGEPLRVELVNKTSLPITMHPHGLILPNAQDGVPFVTQEPVPPGGRFVYDFTPVQAGTFFLHSHYGFELQDQLSAPFILDDTGAPDLAKEVVLLLSDFTFRSPPEILADLEKKKSMSGMKMDSPGPMAMQPDLNDVDYDAFLANYRTLEDPEIVRAEPGATVLLRIINASSASNFFISLGSLEGALVAVDGEPVEPLKGTSFEVAVAQRLDIRLALPPSGGAYPIVAQGEGTAMQTGIVLATAGAEIPKLGSQAAAPAGAIGEGYRQERALKPLRPLAKRPVDQSIPVALGGTMAGYQWTLNGSLWPATPPFVVKKGDRVEFVYKNETGMSHPMHLHGHKFQVTEIDGQPIDGAVRDTILVMPHSTVKVQFDADNPGLWMMHCHILWHEAAGMMGILNYEGFPKPAFYLEKETFDLPSSLAD